MKSVCVTGGCGYIGSHLSRLLYENGYQVTVIDNLSSGFQNSIPQEISFLKGDIRNKDLLDQVFAAKQFSAVFHLAANIEVEESCRKPLKYYDNNTTGTLSLLQVMENHKKLGS